MTSLEQDIDLRLLGSISVAVNGDVVSIGGPRQMAVLARLMLTPDQMVTMDELVDSVWDGDEPAQPQVAIRSYVSNLRKAIEPNRDRRASDSCLASSPPGYRLSVSPSAVDWVRFEDLINQARGMLSAESFDNAVATLRYALKLWKGEPCAGLPDSNPFLAHRGRLVKLRESAVELLFESLLFQGDHALVAAEVEAAIHQNPLRERLTELGMIAFYREGRQSEALALGQRLRGRLLDELGIDPSPSIQTLELKILNHDQSLTPSVRPPQVPISRLARRADGQPTTDTSEFVLTADLQIPRSPHHQNGLASEFPPDLTRTGEQQQPTGSNGLIDLSEPLEILGFETLLEQDAESAVFCGRRQELHALQSIGKRLAVGQPANAVITGEQGIGKTALVRTVAEMLASDDVGVVWARAMIDGGPPLWPWAQVVLSLLECLPGRPSVEYSADLAPLTSLGPSVRGALASDDVGEFEDSDVMLAVTALLRRLARQAPLMIILEDLQWADPRTITMLNYVASSLADTPVGFIATWRETEGAAGTANTRLRELSRLPALTRVALRGLDEAGVRELAEATGHPVSAGEAAAVLHHCDGNPLFIREVLARARLVPGARLRGSLLSDAVIGRMEHLHPDARSVLTIGSLCPGPFTAAFVEVLSDRDHGIVHQVFGLAVRDGVLCEDGSSSGSYRFRHPVVAEVLASELLAADRADMHGIAGRRLLETTGPSYDVAHHLCNSSEPEDRLLGARTALDLLETEVIGERLDQVDEYVKIGSETLKTQRAPGPGTNKGQKYKRSGHEQLSIDIANYSSWRAWVDGRPEQWRQHGTEALLSSQASDSGFGLAVSVLNLAGLPPYPIGPTRTSAFLEPGLDPTDGLSEIVERLPNTEAARWVGQIRLLGRASGMRPGDSNQKKNLREVLKTVGAARRRLPQEELLPVLTALLESFVDAMDRGTRFKLLDEVANLAPGLRSLLINARYGYLTLLEAERSVDARCVALEAVTTAVEEQADPFALAEARMLWIRHLLWTGQLDDAEQTVDEALRSWAAAGLAEPVALIRQRRAIRTLRNQRPGPGHGPDGHDQLLTDRASQPELAFRLARIGDFHRANECLDRSLELAALGCLSLADAAFVAMAGRLSDHEKAALVAYELLEPIGDRPIAREDGSVILGTASLYTGVAASTLGRDAEAAGLLMAARGAVQRFGGSPVSLETMVSALGLPKGSNRVPTKLQSG